MSFQNRVTEIARSLYPKIYCDTSKLTDSEKIKIGDSCSSNLCQLWQEESKLIPGMNLIAEAAVAGTSPIDLLDISNGIAYELKYSHKNVKHEFYKDMFKMIVYNENLQNSFKINTFVFLCHIKGISSLESSMLCRESIRFMAKHGVLVELVELYPETEYDFKVA